MLVNKNTMGHHSHFDKQKILHKDWDNKDPYFLVEEYLAEELQYKSTFFSATNRVELFRLRSLTWYSSTYCERISSKTIIT